MTWGFAGHPRAPVAAAAEPRGTSKGPTEPGGGYKLGYKRWVGTLSQPIPQHTPHLMSCSTFLNGFTLPWPAHS